MEYGHYCTTRNSTNVFFLTEEILYRLHQIVIYKGDYSLLKFDCLLSAIL